MKGRTRSFIEDFVVLAIVVVVGVFAFNYFFSEDEVVQQPSKQPIVESKVVKKESIEKDIENSIKEATTEPVKEIEPIKDENSSVKVNSVQLSDHKELRNAEDIVNKETPIQTTPIKKDEKIEQETVAKKVDPQKIAQFVKEVDIKALREFKDQTKEKMQQAIVLDPNIVTTQELKIRITVLKNGEYEQLTFKGGSKELFEQNQENITSIFPLEITPSIAGDFPRYLRYTFRFEPKQN